MVYILYLLVVKQFLLLILNCRHLKNEFKAGAFTCNMSDLVKLAEKHLQNLNVHIAEIK